MIVVVAARVPHRSQTCFRLACSRRPISASIFQNCVADIVGLSPSAESPNDPPTSLLATSILADGFEASRLVLRGGIADAPDRYRLLRAPQSF